MRMMTLALSLCALWLVLARETPAIRATMLAIGKALAVHFEAARLRTLASLIPLLMNWGSSFAVDLITGIVDE